jgi:hypothetical protein
MIYFSLNKEISADSIIKEIQKLIKKEITTQEKAEKSVLVISIKSEIQNKTFKPKLIEHQK